MALVEGDSFGLTTKGGGESSITSQLSRDVQRRAEPDAGGQGAELTNHDVGMPYVEDLAFAEGRTQPNAAEFTKREMCMTAETCVVPRDDKKHRSLARNSLGTMPGWRSFESKVVKVLVEQHLVYVGFGLMNQGTSCEVVQHARRVAFCSTRLKRRLPQPVYDSQVRKQELLRWLGAHSCNSDGSSTAHRD